VTTKTLRRYLAAFVVSTILYSSIAQAELRWMKPGAPLPAGAAFILAGVEANNVNAGKQIFVCRTTYQGGLHPGKIVAGNCNIAWGGREIVRPQYEVAVASPNSYYWGPPNQAAVAVPGGEETGRSLAICRSEHRSRSDGRKFTSHGVHAGKLLGGDCHFGYGGMEIVSSSYEVLYDAAPPSSSAPRDAQQGGTGQDASPAPGGRPRAPGQ
jgi:Protein of unknown function (DUF3421)